MSYCYHCGEPTPTPALFSQEIDGQHYPMCCRACLAVAQCISDAGLSDYYRLRTENSNRPTEQRALEQLEFSLYDDPAVQAEFCDPADEHCDEMECRLSVAKLHCAACTWLIEHHLLQLPGVTAVNVQLQNAIATIRWQPTAQKLSKIMNGIQQLGYDVLPYSVANRDRQLQEEQDGMLRRLGLAGIGMMQIGMVAIGLYAGDFQGIDPLTRDLLRYFSLAVATPVLLYAAQPFFTGAWRSIKAGQPGMDVPVSIALFSAYSASVLATLKQWPHVYFDTVSMFTFFLLLSRYLQLRIRQAQSPQSALLPPAARKITEGDASAYQWTPLSQLKLGDRIRLDPGETVPVDGKVVSGRSSIETSAFNGEFLPVNVAAGSEILAGSGNIDGSLEVEVLALARQSSIAQMETLLERAHHSKPAFALLANRLASHFVLGVMALALMSYVYWVQASPEQAFVIALSVLVVSCPCALSLATPTTFTAAVSALRKRGIMLRNTDTLERLHKVDRVVFDKTGTLTLGRPKIIRASYFEVDEEQTLQIAAALEQHSNHPIAHAFQKPELHAQDRLPRLVKVRISAGEGVEGNIDGELYRIGSKGFCAPWLPHTEREEDAPNTEVILTKSNRVIARFLLDDSPRPDAENLIAELKQQGIAVSILSGDKQKAVDKIAVSLGVADALGQQRAEDKLAVLKAFQERGERVMMLGDGVNDAPVLASADISVAMNSASTLTRQQADITLVGESLQAVSELFAVAKQSRKILRQNIAWALLYNLSSLPLAAAGLIPPWLAAIGMSASSLIVVLNALRIRRPLAVSQAKANALDTEGVAVHG